MTSQRLTHDAADLTSQFIEEIENESLGLCVYFRYHIERSSSKRPLFITFLLWKES